LNKDERRPDFPIHALLWQAYADLAAMQGAAEGNNLQVLV